MSSVESSRPFETYENTSSDESETPQPISNDAMIKEGTATEVSAPEIFGLNEAGELEAEYQAASQTVQKEIDTQRQAELARKREVAGLD